MNPFSMLPALLFFVGIVHAADYSIDLDLDGIPDDIVVSEIIPPTSTTDKKSVHVKITFSTSAAPIDVIVTNFEYFMAYGRQNMPGYFVFDYTNRNTRQAPDSYWELYKWNAEYKTMCLHATISGVPADQLAGEVYPSVQNILFYGKCLGMNQTQNFPETELLDLAKSGLRTQIVIDKANLFSLPSNKSLSKMYLVKGDFVLIREHKYSDGVDWYLVEYLPTGKVKPIIKWIQGKAVDSQF